MNEESQEPTGVATAAPLAAHPPGVPQTGNSAVDEVLAEVVAVADRPVQEHVAVFERAQERLRSALDAPGE